MKASFFTESILYWLVRGVSAFSQRVPLAASTAAGRAAGGLAYHLLPRRRVVALGNLRAAFGSTYTPREYQMILREMFQNFGMTLLEVARIPKIDRRYVDRWVLPSPGSRERVEAARSLGRGVIFLTAHFGNWELCSIAGALHGYPTLVLAREQGWPRLNALLNRYRESKGCRVVSKGFMIRQLIRGLEEGRIVGILADQDGGRNGVLAPFFGRLASTAPGTIALSLNTGAPILPVFVVRRRGSTHTLVVEEPLAIPATGSLEERIQAGIAAYLAVLERYVQHYPSQWLWLHRRWKSSPQKRLLLISDGKAGHVAQLKALKDRIETAWGIRAKEDKRLAGIRGPLVRTEIAQVRYRHPLWRGVVALAASLLPCRFPYGDFLLRCALTPDSYGALRSLHADYSISCGSATAGVNLLWSWGIGARAVHVTRSQWPSWKRFHLSVIPRHDCPPQAIPGNLLVMDGALAPSNGIDPSRLMEWRGLLGITKPRQIGLLLGGAARNVRLDFDQMEEMLLNLLKSCDTLDAELLVTSSRRTPLSLETRLIAILKDNPRCRLLALPNQNQTGGLPATSDAVPCILGLAQTIVVSGDSISMVSEALSSQKPVVSFFPKAAGVRWRRPKYHRFLEQMAAEGKMVVAEPGEVGDAVVKASTHPPQAMTPGAADPIVEFLAKWL